jgi:parvulin-like peptidyl-prolyl isomerase
LRRIAVFVLVAMGFAAGAVWAAPDGVVAWVDGAPVPISALLRAGAGKAPENGPNLSDSEKQEVLADLVEEEVLYQEAKRRHLDEDPRVRKVMVNTLLREEVYANVSDSDFPDDVLRAYFEAHRDEFVVPEKVQILAILYTGPDAKAAAQRAAATLKQDPSKFKELAKGSQSAWHGRGGDVGFVGITGKPGLDPAIVDHAWPLRAGEISAPFQTADGWNLVKAENRRERVDRTFEQMKGSVLRKVKNEEYRHRYEAYVASVRPGHDVRIERATLDGLDVPGSSRAAPSGALMLDEEQGDGDER